MRYLIAGDDVAVANLTQQQRFLLRIFSGGLSAMRGHRGAAQG